VGVFLIEGNIENGDYEKLKKLIYDYGNRVYHVHLASPGGSVLEAMKLAYPVNALTHNM